MARVFPPAHCIQPWKWKTEFGTARSVVTEDDCKRVRADLRDSSTILLDTETDSVGPDRKLKLVQVAVPRKPGKKLRVWLIDPRRYALLTRSQVDNLGGSHRIVAHNAPFDILSIGSTYHKGEELYDWATKIALSGRVFCTMMADQVLRSERYNNSLAKLAVDEGVHNNYEIEWSIDANNRGYTNVNRYEYADVDQEAWLKYSAHDVFQLNAAYNNVRRRMKSISEENAELIHTETQVSVLYAILCHQGMRISMDKCAEVHEDMGSSLDVIKERLAEHDIHAVCLTTRWLRLYRS